MLMTNYDAAGRWGDVDIYDITVDDISMAKVVYFNCAFIMRCEINIIDHVLHGYFCKCIVAVDFYKVSAHGVPLMLWMVILSNNHITLGRHSLLQFNFLVLLLISISYFS